MNCRTESDVMKTKLCLVTLTLFCAIIVAKEADMEKKLNIRSLISPEVASSSSVAHTPYCSPQALDVRNNLDENIRDREVEYSWFWIERVMRQAFLSGANKTNAQTVAGIGLKKDDGVILSWDSNGYEFEIIDSRLLTLLIQKQGLGSIDVVETFKTVINYEYHCNKDIIQVALRDVVQLGQGESYGEILVDRGNAKGWFKDVIGWYKKDDTLLLIFNKFLTTPSSKISIRDATRVVGGIAWDDERSFLRFEKSNRTQLAEEYLQKKNKNVQSDPRLNKETKGVPLYK